MNNDTDKKSGFSIASIIISVLPLAILLLVFLICLIVSGGASGDNDRGAVWWLFISTIWIIIPVASITSILSVIFGILGLRRKKTAFAWTGIIIVCLEVVAALLAFAWLLS